MKALPVRFYDKKIGKKVQAFEVDFNLCYDPNHEDVECVFFCVDNYPSCFCTYAAIAAGLGVSCSVIFLEVKE